MGDQTAQNVATNQKQTLRHRTGVQGRTGHGLETSRDLTGRSGTQTVSVTFLGEYSYP